MSSLGNYSLALAVLAAGFTFLMGVTAFRQGGAGAFRGARVGIAALVVLFTLAAAALGAAFVQDQFSIKYVADYSERAMPIGYKLAAFWAGQDGSLLLWGWMLAIMAGILAFAGRREQAPEHGIALATLAAMVGFFAAVMLFAANPFALGPSVADGHGMNPQLQHPAMIAHPPFLFLGYAGCMVPFALMAGPLVTGRADNPWLGSLRRWMVAGWLFLTIGIVLGSWWAYLELGWGGYWGWDPVENASLFPWLIATAVLHAVMVWQARGIFKVWLVGLTSLALVMCILAAYITRGGVINSVHAFPDSPVGKWFLAFLIVSLVAGLGLTIWRCRRLKAENPLEELFSKEGVLLLTCILLLAMTLVTVFGTLRPLFASKDGAALMADPSWYNTFVIPMAVALLALMAMGPLLAYGKGGAGQLARRLWLPAGLALVVATGAGWVALRHQELGVDAFLTSSPTAGISVRLTGSAAPAPVAEAQPEGITRFTLQGTAHSMPVVFTGIPPKGFGMGELLSVQGHLDPAGGFVADTIDIEVPHRHAWALVCLFIGVTAVLAMLTEFGRALAERMRQQGENVLAATVRLVDGNHRRYGGQVVHLGMVMVMAGVAGSSLFVVQRHLVFTVAAPTQQFEGYTVTCAGLLGKTEANAREAVPQVLGPNYAADQVTLRVTTPSGEVHEVNPQRRKYYTWPQYNNEVALLSSLREDFYTTVYGWDRDAQNHFTVVIDARINPLVNWIWIGTLVMGIGGLLALAPRLFPLRAPQPNPARERAVAVGGTAIIDPSVEGTK